MKLNYNTTATIILVAFLSVLTISATTQDARLKAIYYTLYKGEETSLRLVNELEEQLSGNPELYDRNFYVTFSECNNEQNIVLNYCEGCELQGLIKASNRFLILNQAYKLPVIFEGDKIHSNYVTHKDMEKPEPIVYTLENGQDVVTELVNGINEYKRLLPKLDLQNSDFYITYNECADQRIAILGYCKGCAFKELIASTNRYFVLENDLKLPIVFESDRQHSNFFSSPDGIRIFITNEGYMVVADKDNNIISKGFTQY